MEDPHEILTFYETPRCSVVGISPIPKENIVPVFQEDIDKIRLEEIGELEMSLEETTVTKYDPYSPPIPVGQPKKKISKLLKTPLRYLSNGKNVLNIRGPLDSPSSNASTKPWRPFLLKSPQTSPVPQNTMFSPCIKVHHNDSIKNHESGAANKEETSSNMIDLLEDKKPSFSDIFNKYNQDTDNAEKHSDSPRRDDLERKFETSICNSHTKNIESLTSAEHHSNTVQESYKVTDELKSSVNKPSDSIKENNINNSVSNNVREMSINNTVNDSHRENYINNSLNNHKVEEEDPFISEIEREINKFCNVLSGSEISSPIKILTQSAGQVNLDKVTPNKNLSFDKPKKNGDRAQQNDNVLATFNRNRENKYPVSNCLVSGDEKRQPCDDLDELFPPKKKVKIEINHTDSSSHNKNYINKENDPKCI
ncbi:unnamed protein product [Meganyctiphanes norvegica]|uniref:Exophilin 5 n=1 Tax=Meganyctiphanes norvegica TaxID=48144 RepID=A0AAV2S6C5_MEGNR